MAQRIRELEESFANTLPTPSTAIKSPRCSVRIFEPTHTATWTPGGSNTGEVVNVDEDGSSPDESEDAEWNDDDGNDDTSTVGKTTSAPTPKYPSRTSRSATGANAARSSDGVR